MQEQPDFATEDIWKEHQFLVMFCLQKMYFLTKLEGRDFRLTEGGEIYHTPSQLQAQEYLFFAAL